MMTLNQSAHPSRQLPRWRRRVVASVFLFLLATPFARADLEIAHAQATIVDEQLRVIMDLQLELGDAAEEALDNGIPLTIAVEMQLHRTRSWLPDDLVSDWRKDFVLRYHSLSTNYIVSELGRGKIASFETLRDALIAIGQNRVIVVPMPTLPTNPSINYNLRVRVRLDIESLPSPLSLLGYILPDWRISSHWTQWPVRS